MADRGDYKGIMLDTAERSYSEKRLKQSRLVYRLLGSIGKPKSFDRFRIQAASCLTHDTYELLDHITCPTLVIGGKEDKIVTGQASVEIAGRIADCKLVLCNLGTVLLFLSPCTQHAAMVSQTLQISSSDHNGAAAQFRNRNLRNHTVLSAKAVSLHHLSDGTGHLIRMLGQCPSKKNQLRPEHVDDVDDTDPQHLLGYLGRSFCFCPPVL